MSRISVKNTVPVYEILNADAPLEKAELQIGVNSSDDNDDFVELVIGDHAYVVAGEDLKTAINNAMNTGGV